MANLSKPQISFSKSDFKKATLKANKKLESRNKSIESSVKAQEKQLKSLGKEYDSESKKLRKLLIDVEFQEDRFQKLKGAISSNEKLLTGKLNKVGNAEKELCDYESAVEKLEDKERKLLDEIAKLEFYKSKCSESKIELAGIQAKKDNALDKLSSVKSDISKAITEGKKKVTYYEDQYDSLEEKAKRHEEMVYQFEQRLVETQDLFKDEESKLKDLLAKSKVEKEKANNELQAIKNLCNDTEDEYIKWEVKIERAKAKVGKEEEKHQKKVERSKKWDISFLEEVAKKKLKNKVDNIDKAGLRDIIDG